MIIIASQEIKDSKENKVTKLIKKSEGGIIHHPKGIMAKIPENSLNTDTEITILSDQPLPEAGGIKRLSPAGNTNYRQLKPISDAVEFGTEGTVFSQPVEISLPYDPAKLNGANENEIRICYYNSTTNQWEEMDTRIDKILKLAKIYTNHFSIYVVMAPEMPEEDFKLHEVYVYPNPVKTHEKPVFHIECGIADKVRIKIYTVSGRIVFDHTITGIPQMINDRNGLDYAYEYTVHENLPSGIYYYYIEAEKSGKKLKDKGKFAVVR